MDGSAPPSTAPTEDEDFDLNAEELPDEGLTPEASNLEPEESLETEDEASDEEDTAQNEVCLFFYF